jgi:hypothetical protein
MLNLREKVRTASIVAVSLLPITTMTFVEVQPASAASLPNACSILKAAHPQTIGGAVSGGYSSLHLSTFWSCSVTVGTVTVDLFITRVKNGTQGTGTAKVSSLTHPSGLGLSSALKVGTLSIGGPYDEVDFNNKGIWASITANGAVPAMLLALGRKAYSKL